jgi:hypothetical protein
VETDNDPERDDLYWKGPEAAMTTADADTRMMTAEKEPGWIDIAPQLAGDSGVQALGPAARATPPGTDAIGTRILPKMRSSSELKIGVDFSVSVDAGGVTTLTSELRQILQDLGLADSVRIEWQGQGASETA